MSQRCFVLGGLMLVLAGCQPASERSDRSASAAVARMDALDQAAIAFVGNHSRAEIKQSMDRAMSLYGLELTEDNYSRAGSVLVALQGKNGTAEMAILDYMIRSHVEGVRLSFGEAAALASVFLLNGDR
jgi:hypothetical protein